MFLTKEIIAANFNRGILNHINAVEAFGSSIPMVNKNLENTEYHQAFVVNGNSIGYIFSAGGANGSNVDDRPERITKTFFSTIAAYLSKAKVTDSNKATALVLKDSTGVFKFAGIVQYHENDNPDEPGNWSFTMTFNEDDITALERKKEVNKILCGDTTFQHMFDTVGYDVARVRMEHSSYIMDACYITIETILQILDREAKAGEVVDIEFPGYFVASVSVEDDEKIFAITPEGHLKAIVKDDKALEIDI